MSALQDNPFQQTQEFYRRELEQAFRYSRRFSERRGVSPGQMVETADYEAIVRECTPGGLDCARRIGDTAVVMLDSIAAGPWWRDLLNYERAWFLQSATTAEGPPTNRPRRGLSAICLNFSWDIPEVIKRIEPGESVPEQLRRPITLVFSRGPEGRVYVAQVSHEIERVFRATNGLRTVEQIALIASLSSEQTSQILNSLAGIGAIVPAMSSARMMQQIEAREKQK